MSKRVDAVVVFDEGVPVPHSQNCMTRSIFYDSLVFDAVLFTIPFNLKGSEDSVALKWVINNFANKEDRYKKSHATRYCFFVTKDTNFRKDSDFNKSIQSLLPDAKIVLINIPSYKIIRRKVRGGGESRSKKDLNRRQLLDIIVARLNDAWINRSPK